MGDQVFVSRAIVEDLDVFRGLDKESRAPGAETSPAPKQSESRRPGRDSFTGRRSDAKSLIQNSVRLLLNQSRRQVRGASTEQGILERRLGRQPLESLVLHQALERTRG